MDILLICLTVFFILTTCISTFALVKMLLKQKAREANDAELSALYRDTRSQENVEGIISVAVSSMMRIFPKARRCFAVTFDKEGYSNYIYTSGYLYDKTNPKLFKESTLFYIKEKMANPTVFTNVDKEPIFAANSSQYHESGTDNHTVSSLLCFPIRINHETFGVITLFTLDHKNDFNENDRTKLNDISGLYSRYVENAIFSSLLKNSANTDELTGVLNRQALMKKFEDELLDVKNNMTTRSVVMLDLDDFKIINDTYGHIVGDKALVHFTSFIKAYLTHGDFCGRYGGDEFVIVFRNLNLEATKRRMKEIKDALNESPVEGDVYVKFSYGIQIVDNSSDLNSVQSIMSLVDKEMYEQKNAKKLRKEKKSEKV